MAMRESCTKYFTSLYLRAYSSRAADPPSSPPLQPGQPPTLDSRSSRCRKAATAYQRGSFFSGARIAAAAVRPALDVHQLTLQLEAIVRTGPVH